MLKSVLRLFKTYQNAKDEAVEETVNYFEAKTNSMYFVVFLAISLYGWFFAIFQAIGLEELYNFFGFYPIGIFFLTSYFLFFLGSKLLFKPTEEELSDDTSTFAIFSACNRRSQRSLVSIFFSIFHTLIFVLYLVSKDLKQ